MLELGAIDQRSDRRKEVVNDGVEGPAERSPEDDAHRHVDGVALYGERSGLATDVQGHSFIRRQSPKVNGWTGALPWPACLARAS